MDGADFDGRTTFLHALREARSVSWACREAGVSRAAIFARREQDDSFRAEWDEALAEGIELLEDALRDYAIGKKGEREGATDKEGQPVKQTYDGALLRFLLKARRPDVYGAHPRAGRADASEPIWMDPDPPRSDQGSDR